MWRFASDTNSALALPIKSDFTNRVMRGYALSLSLAKWDKINSLYCGESMIFEWSAAWRAVEMARVTNCD